MSVYPVIFSVDRDPKMQYQICGKTPPENS